MTGLNPYNIQKKCGLNPLCYDFSDVETLLNLGTTREALHVSKKLHKWASCNMGINLKFQVDWMNYSGQYVADPLNSVIPTLIYVGGIDFMCD